jgi:hypothetical protein
VNNAEFLEKMKDKVKNNEDITNFEIVVFIEIVACLQRKLNSFEEVIESRKVCDKCNGEIRKALKD